MTERRAWSFLTVEGTRQYGGNTGYDDEPSTVYRFDSDVANHLQVQPGDIAVIRTKARVIGVAQIGDVEESAGQKDRLRCPKCAATNIKRRATKRPPWICKAGHTFNEPDVEPVAVTKYAAHYSKTFVACPDELTLDRVQKSVIRPSDQMSIKEIDLSKIEKFLRETSAGGTLIRAFAGNLTVPDGDDGEEPSGSIIDQRRKVLRQISLRRGQSRFRHRLIKRYGERCQVSGCHFPGLIEAAHIRPYATSEDNGARNGLLLRSDLHTLFDLGLLGVEPASLRVVLNPALDVAGYSDFQNRDLQINGTSGPMREGLEERWEFFSAVLAN